MGLISTWIGDVLGISSDERFFFLPLLPAKSIMTSYLSFASFIIDMK